MRIISGKFKGRKLADSSHLKGLRPTTDMNREALFNILQSGKFIKQINFSLQDAVILDICCGTGAVAFEALSRGAKSAYLVDINSKHLEIAKENAKILNVEDQVKFSLADAANLSQAKEKFDLVYIDPPYADNASDIIKNLVEKNWIDENSLVIIESSDSNYGENSLALLDQRKYGRTYFSFFKIA